jgi:hypothetical protein
VKNGVLHVVQEGRNIVRTIKVSMKRRKANWIGHILCRNWVIKHVIEGRIEVKERR